MSCVGLTAAKRHNKVDFKFSWFLSAFNAHELSYLSYRISCESNNVDYGMRKGKKNDDYSQWERCAKLAIDWNSSDIARHNIFNLDNRCHWRVSHNLI